MAHKKGKGDQITGAPECTYFEAKNTIRRSISRALTRYSTMIPGSQKNHPY